MIWPPSKTSDDHETRTSGPDGLGRMEVRNG